MENMKFDALCEALIKATAAHEAAKKEYNDLRAQFLYAVNTKGEVPPDTIVVTPTAGRVSVRVRHFREFLEYVYTPESIREAIAYRAEIDPTTAAAVWLDLKGRVTGADRPMYSEAQLKEAAVRLEEQGLCGRASATYRITVKDTKGKALNEDQA